MTPRVVIIGAGPGGYAAAIEAARLGGNVTLIEREAAGGTCLNRGCIPAKTWKTAADRLRTIHDAGNFGIEIPGKATVDTRRLLARSRAVISTLAGGIHARLKQHGVRYLEGTASPDTPSRILVRRRDGAVEKLPADRLIIATGSAPRPLPFLPFDHDRILSTDDALELAELPESLAIIGGGVSGCEFATIFSALGSRVTLVETAPHLLPGNAFDRDSITLIEREMKKRGVTLLTGHTVEDTGHPEEHVRLLLRETGASGARRTVDAEKILVSAGRIPASGGFDTLPAIARDGDGWILVNDRMETTVPGVYAIGDILGPSRMMLAHTASAEGITAARNALGERTTMDYTAIPSVLFTTPEAAGVGLTGEEAHSREPEAYAATVQFRSIGRAHTTGEIEGQAKLIAGRDGRLIGVHIVGAHATELIAAGALAVKQHLSAAELAGTVHAHPTFAEALRDAAVELVMQMERRNS